MPLRRLLTAVSVIAMLGCFGLVACSDDEEENEEEHEHEATSPSCAEIMETCHAADTGSGPAHDCHELAHADAEADCAVELASCTATCEAILTDGGM